MLTRTIRTYCLLCTFKPANGISFSVVKTKHIFLNPKQLVDRTWNDVQCLTKWRESLLRQTLHFHVTSVSQKLQSSDWPKWSCTLSLNVISRISLGHWTTFQAVCQYINLNQEYSSLTCLMDSSGSLSAVGNIQWGSPSSNCFFTIKTSFLSSNLSAVFSLPLLSASVTVSEGWWPWLDYDVSLKGLYISV